MSERGERQKGGEGVETDTLTDELGGDEESFQRAAEYHDRPCGDDSRPRVKLLEGDEGGEEESDDGANIGDEDQRAGEESDGEGEIQPDERQGEGVKDGHDGHNGELSVQEFAENIVQVAGDFQSFLAEAGGERGGEFAADNVTVADEIKHCQRGDEQGESEGGDGVESGSEDVDGGGGGIFGAAESDGLNGVLGGLLRVEILEMPDDFGVFGAEPFHCILGDGGQNGGELGGLGGHKGKDGKGGGEKEGKKERSDNACGGPWGSVSVFQLLRGGRRNIGGDGGQHKGRKGFGGGINEPSARQNGESEGGKSGGGHFLEKTDRKTRMIAVFGGRKKTPSAGRFFSFCCGIIRFPRKKARQC